MESSKSIFSRFTHTFKYFKQPYKIGEIVSLNGAEHLIIGIENIQINSLGVNVAYTTQILNNHNFSYKPFAVAIEDASLVEMYIKEKFDSKKLRDFKLGMTTHATVRGIRTLYKLMEYTDIEFVSTDMQISGNFKLVVPNKPAEVKELFKQRKREALKLELI